MTQSAKLCLFLIVSCVLLAIPGAPRAQTVPTTLFQTTFNCPDWDQGMGLGDAVVCGVGDGISGSGAWTTSAGSKDQITSLANRPAGGGGKGFRHWRGDGYNNVGGGLRISLPVPVYEMWVRFYMRYEAGFSWQNGRPGGTKENYWHAGTSKAIYFGFSGGVLRFVANGYPYESSMTWNTIMGSSVGDGQWHAYEYYVKADTNGSSNVGNGLGKIWVDGVLVLDRNDLNWNKGPWDSFFLGENQETPTNGHDMYTDYDDLAVSMTGRVGGSPTAPPAAPLNLRIVK